MGLANFKATITSSSLLIFFVILLSACSQTNNNETSYGAIIMYENARYRGQEAIKIDEKSLSKIGEISKRVPADTPPTENLSSNALDEETEVFQDTAGNLLIPYSEDQYQVFEKENN